jgi:hypothetical protein
LIPHPHHITSDSASFGKRWNQPRSHTQQSENGQVDIQVLGAEAAREQAVHEIDDRAIRRRLRVPADQFEAVQRAVQGARIGELRDPF